MLSPYWSFFSEDIKCALPFYPRDLEEKKKKEHLKEKRPEQCFCEYLSAEHGTHLAVIPINTFIECCSPQLLFASQAIKTKPGLSLNQGTTVLLDQAGVNIFYL